MGHVLVAKRVGSDIISVVDSVGAGRRIDPALYQGYIK